MEPKKSDILQGTLDLLILKTVALGPIHGYGIAQRILQVSREVLQIQQGSLYPALHRLEKKELLQSEWKESESGRMGKFYTLTELGKSHLAKETAEWQRYAQAILWVLEENA